jgi:hypothetical protein
MLICQTQKKERCWRNETRQRYTARERERESKHERARCGNGSLNQFFFSRSLRKSVKEEILIDSVMLLSVVTAACLSSNHPIDLLFYLILLHIMPHHHTHKKECFSLSPLAHSHILLRIYAQQWRNNIHTKSSLLNRHLSLSW